MKKLPILITVAVLVLGVGFFLATDGIGKQARNSGAIYTDMQIKTAYLPNGEVKLLALADNNKLKAYTASEGTNQPTENSMVLGSAEAQMMKSEKLITGAGSSFDDFFGIKTSVAGILENTSTPLDDMHFLSQAQYSAIKGEEGRVFVVRSKEGMGKLFYTKGVDEQTPLPLTLAEGNLADYNVQTINGKEYSPVIVGYIEAKMMKEEKLFSKPGDTINGFFGKDVVIVGVLAENKTAVDMMHITPFKQGELA